MVQALMSKRGIEIEARSRGGLTPLMCAIESGSVRTLEECLNRGFNPFTFDNFLMTPMDYAKKFPDVDSQDFQLLVQKAQE